MDTLHKHPLHGASSPQYNLILPTVSLSPLSNSVPQSPIRRRLLSILACSIPSSAGIPLPPLPIVYTAAEKQVPLDSRSSLHAPPQRPSRRRRPAAHRHSAAGPGRGADGGGWVAWVAPGVRIGLSMVEFILNLNDVHAQIQNKLDAAFLDASRNYYCMFFPPRVETDYFLHQKFHVRLRLKKIEMGA